MMTARRPSCSAWATRVWIRHDVGTGSVDAADAPLFQLIQYALELPVGADDDGILCRQLPAAGYLADALPSQILHHMGIVDQIPQHPAPVGSGRRGLLRQLHGPADTVAKTGALGQDHSSHSGFPPTAWSPKA